MIVMTELLTKQRTERLESLHQLLDAIYDEPAIEEQEEKAPTEEEKRERMIWLTLSGLW